MNCNEFKNRLASLKEVDHLDGDMAEHLEHCPTCHEMHAKMLTLYNIILEEKSEKISPFINTRIMANISSREARTWQTKPSFVTVLSIFFVMLGFFSAKIFTQSPLMTTDHIEIIASDYYFTENPGSQLEKIWLNTYSLDN